MGNYTAFSTETSYHGDSACAVLALPHSSNQLAEKYQSSAKATALMRTRVHVGTLVFLNIQTGTCLEHGVVSVMSKFPLVGDQAMQLSGRELGAPACFILTWSWAHTQRTGKCF